VHLIGEHTDYHEGFVLPSAAIDVPVGGVSRRGRIAIWSPLLREMWGKVGAADLDNFRNSLVGPWSDYPIGVAWALQEPLDTGASGAYRYVYGRMCRWGWADFVAAIEVSTVYALLSRRSRD